MLWDLHTEHGQRCVNLASKDKVTKIILESNKEYLLSKFWGKNNGQISPLSSKANNPTPHSLLSRMIAPSGISFGWKSFNFLSWTPSLLDSKNMIHDHLGKRGNASEKTGRLARHSRAHLVSHQLYQTVTLSPLDYKTGNVWTGIRYLASLKEFSARVNILLVSGLTWCCHQKLGLHKMHHSLCCNTRRFWTYQAIYVGRQIKFLLSSVKKNSITDISKVLFCLPRDGLKELINWIIWIHDSKDHKLTHTLMQPKVKIIESLYFSSKRVQGYGN